MLSRSIGNVQTGSVTDRFSENSSLTDLAKNAPGVYRYISIGHSLRVVLGQLYQEKKINSFQQSYILSAFDRKMSTAMGQLYKVAKYPNSLPLEFSVKKVGKKEKYKYIDGLWNVILKDVIVDQYRNPIRLHRAQLITDNYSDKSFDQFKIIQSITGRIKDEIQDED